MIREPQNEMYRNARRIARRLQEAGHEALFAGGCVRDMLLDVDPKDYDLATAATPAEVMDLFPKTQQVGVQFGTVLVIEGGVGYEVTTFRTEGPYSDGRRPDSVEFARLEQDAQRRDFTVNAMYWDPVSQRLVDTVGGREDLERRVLRAVGDPAERFREDHLRVVRAVRFAARLSLTIEPETRQALKSAASLVEEIVPERLQQELRIILTDRDPASALRMMDDLDMLCRIFPELQDAKTCPQPDNYHPEGDVFVHSLLTVEKLGPHPDFVSALAALLHDVGKPEASRRSEPLHFPEHERIGRDMVEEICRRLRLPRAETDRIVWLVKRHMYFKAAREMKVSTLKRLFAEPGFEQLCGLHRADALASWGRLDDLQFVLDQRAAMPPEVISPPPLITGHDLIARGHRPGPALGRMLEAVREAQLQGEITGREEALETAERVAAETEAPRD